MARTRFALILYFLKVAYKAACYILYPVKGFLEVYEDIVQILSMLKVLFAQESEVEDLFCGASFGSEPCLFDNNYLIGLGLKPFQDNLQHDFSRVNDKADGSAVWQSCRLPCLWSID